MNRIGGLQIRANWQRIALVFLAYFGLALALTYPAMTEFSTRFIGGDTSDAYEMAHHVWWFRHALSSGEDVFYHSLLAYPDGFPAVTLRANPLRFFPTWLFAFALPLPAAYNLGILLSLTLNGTAMYSLARRRVSPGRQIPALMAGLIYMLFPAFQGHLFDAHIGSVFAWAPPLLLICLFEYVEDGRKRFFVLSALFFFLSTLGHTLQFVYVLSPLMSLFFLARLVRRDFVGAARTALVAAAGSLLLLLLLLPLLSAPDSIRAYIAAGGHVRYSIDLLGIASPSFENPFWRDIATHSRRVLGTNLGEGSSYIGVAGGLLALVGCLRMRAARWWLLVAAVSWLLALGPVLKVFDEALRPSVAGYSTIIPLPFALLMNLPFVELARGPGRFMFLFALSFAMIAGYGMAALCSSPVLQRRRSLSRYGFALALALLIFSDYRFFGSFPSVPAGIPQAIHDLAQRNDIRAVYNVPHDHLLAAKEAMYLQTAHGKPLIAGQDTRVTPVDPAKLELLATFEPALLNDAGADIVIINKRRAAERGKLEALYGLARQRLGLPAYDGDRFAIFETRPRRAAASRPVWTSSADNGSRMIYIFKSRPGWLELRADLQAEKRRVRMSLNGVPLQSLEVTGHTALRMPLPIARRGYSTFSIKLDPPCPHQYDTAALRCYGVSLDSVDIRELSRGAIYDPIRIAGGIELSGYHMRTESSDETVIHLWWRFETGRAENEQRFIHVLDEQRRLMRQDDISFGAAAAGSDHLESARIDISDFAPGEYLALTGWYSLPDMVRYDVLTDVEGAQDNTIALGTIRVRA